MGDPATDDSPAFSLLEARHVDDLKSSVDALAKTLKKEGELRAKQHKEDIAAQTAQMAVLERIAKHAASIAENTASLPVLMAALTSHSNGHGATTSEEDPE